MRSCTILLLSVLQCAVMQGQMIDPSPYWKNQIAFPYDSFCARGTSKEAVKWVKFTIVLAPYDPNVVYFQDSRKYVFHYDFATKVLDPFLGMTTQQFNAVTLFAQNQRAILGTVILPPARVWPTQAEYQEYGIQFVRQVPFTREQIRDLFYLVRAQIAAPPDVRACYFPTYEQQAVAVAQREWFESQGIPLGSTARWAKGNTCYAEGWALGTMRFFPGDQISAAYHSSLLGPSDILLTDGIPAEVPFIAGIVSLAPSTPNSHVALLARAYAVPFVYLARAEDAKLVQELVGRRVAFSAYESIYGGCDVRLIDTSDVLDDATAAQIALLKAPPRLRVTPMAPLGAFGTATEGLLPSDIGYVGGKAANFGILRRAVPENSPRAVALSFDLWNAFLDQPLVTVPSVRVGPREHILLWADGDDEQGPTHVGFRLSRDGESVALFDADGRTRIDLVRFGPQARDVSYGRSVDAGDVWQSFAVPTPGRPNSDAGVGAARGLVINEIMADNRQVIEDPCEPGEYPDWIELYNASDKVIVLDGMYLTDDVNDPGKWRVRPATTARTLRTEIEQRLAKYDSYPPPDMPMLSRDLALVRSLFTSPDVVRLGDALREGIVGVLADPTCGLDPGAMLRFRSSTNVEDSEDFMGAGLYDSFSGCLADALDDDNAGPCACDPNRRGERDIFEAIRRVFASFYNDNAFLERRRHDVNEAAVGMALLVHASFPDEIELANGVATVEINGPNANSEIALVSQQGAVSVTNPQDGSTPEEVTVTILPSGSVVPPKLKQPSGLIPLGGTVMAWPRDYMELTDLLLRVSDVFAEITGKTRYVLDLEYKKVVPGGAALSSGGLVIKQVRQVPAPGEGATETPFLINVPVQPEVFPGEFELFDRTDVFADHRVKSRYRLETFSMPLDVNHLSERLYGRIQMEYVDGTEVRTLTTDVSLLPFASHSFDGQSVTDSWRLTDLDNTRTYLLQTTGIPTAVSKAQNPLLVPADFGTRAFNLPYRCLALDVQYQQFVPSWRQQLWPNDPPSGLRPTTKDRVYLWSCPPPHPHDVPQERAFASGTLSIRTSFYFPPPPTGFSDWQAHTAPIKRWGRTVIEGLTATPITLVGYYSQTYRPEHHNLIEHFLFEPQLEPALSPEILDHLADLDIRFIHLIIDNRPAGDQSGITTYGYGDMLEGPGTKH